MDIKYYNQDVKQITRQRVVFFILLVVSLAINLLLSVAVLYKKESVILVPGVDHEYTISDGALPKAYIEDIASVVASNLFDLTASNIEAKQKSMEKFTTPSFYNYLQDYFQQQKAQAKEYKLSTTFSIQDMIIDENSRKIILKGVHYSFFGKNVEQKEKIFVFDYEVKNKRLYITNFTEGALNEEASK